MKKLFIALILIISAYTVCGNINTINSNRTKAANTGFDYLDVVYKKTGNKELLLDLYTPTNKVFKKAPLIVYFHGGAWTLGDKQTDMKALDGLFKTLREKGYAIASVDYRLLSFSARFPACIEDCTDAIRYLTANAREYGLDAERIATMGSSAGAHLALLAGLDGGAYVTDDRTDYSVRCIVDLFGPTAFVDLDNIGIEKCFATDIFFGFGASNQIYVLASPLFHLNRHSPPIFIAHGESDSVVNIKHSQLLYERAVALGIDVDFIAVGNAEHGLTNADPNKPLTPTMKEICIRIVSFIEKNMGQAN